MSKPVSRRPDAHLPQKPMTPAVPLVEPEPTSPDEPPASPACLSWEWRFVSTLWASAFGFMLTYEAFRMIRSIIN